jgi:hypothetical protein
MTGAPRQALDPVWNSPLSYGLTISPNEDQHKGETTS